MNTFFDMIQGLPFLGTSYIGEPGGGGAPDNSAPGSAAPAAGAPPAPGAAPAPEPAPGSGQPPANPPSPQEILDWRKDERYGRMWNKGGKIQLPEDTHKAINEGIYQSYRNMEKIYEPTKKELETLKKDKDAMSALAKEYGISLDKLKDVLEEHKSFKDPNNPVVSRGNYFSAWLDDPKLGPVYKEKVTAFFQDLEQQEMERRYPGMNADQRQKMIDYEHRIAAIETKEREDAKTKAAQEHGSLIDKGIARAKEHAKSRGFTITPEMEKNLLDHCMKNNVLPQNVFYAFRELYDAEVDKVYVEKVKAEQLQNLDKNRKSVTIPAGGAGAPAAADGSGGSILDKLKRTAGLN